MPAGLHHAVQMRRPTTILFALILAAGCARDGSCRPAPPDPEPACKPGEDCPVDGEQPGKPLEQPTPTPAPPP